MKIGDRVSTQQGEGKIVAIEHYNRLEGGINRYGVALDENPFFYSPAYYWPHELTAVGGN